MASEYFDPEVIARVQKLEVRARKVVEGYMLGLHRSPFRGISVEFAEHRPYVYGDDIRHLDWKVYARLDRFYIKQHEQETNLRCQLVLDCSESMMYKGDAPLSKFEYGATMFATMAYLLIQQQDACGLTLFDKDVRTSIPPKATLGHYHSMLNVLDGITPGSTTMVGGSLGKVAAQLKRRGMVVIISDFLDDVSPISHGLNRLNFDGHDVMMLHIADPYEKDFPFSGPSIIEGLEKMGNLTCDPADLRGVYLRERAAHLEELHGVCKKMNFSMEEIVTSDPVDVSLSAIITHRTEFARR
jgi:uncharacterized protein (DUF58 family)